MLPWLRPLAWPHKYRVLARFLVHFLRWNFLNLLHMIEVLFALSDSRVALSDVLHLQYMSSWRTTKHRCSFIYQVSRSIEYYGTRSFQASCIKIIRTSHSNVIVPSTVSCLHLHGSYFDNWRSTPFHVVALMEGESRKRGRWASTLAPSRKLYANEKLKLDIENVERVERQQ